MLKRIGILINPLAGMGGAVGLAGTDGMDTFARAMELGARAHAPHRVGAALEQLRNYPPVELEFVAGAGDMGATFLQSIGISPIVVHGGSLAKSCAADTKLAVSQMVHLKIDLLLFAGGDGTARDILDVVGDRLPVIGVPAGVKMHSAVFGISPRAAGKLARDYLEKTLPLELREVMDLDENKYRRGEVSALLYGYMLVPKSAGIIQGVKASRPNSDRRALEGIANEIIDRMKANIAYMLGPGTTTKYIAQKLGLEKTLLGMDVVLNGAVLFESAGERELLRCVEDHKSYLILTIIGGQGHILGRGNQQISPNVLRKLERDKIVVVATADKLASLKGKPLIVDTGDEQLDQSFRGYLRVVTGSGTETCYLVD